MVYTQLPALIEVGDRVYCIDPGTEPSPPWLSYGSQFVVVAMAVPFDSSDMYLSFADVGVPLLRDRFVRLVDVPEWERRHGRPTEPADADPVNHPQHYRLTSGVEVIDLTEQLDFLRGNAVKYLARAGRKDGADELEDLRKAQWYVTRAITKLEQERAQ